MKYPNMCKRLIHIVLQRCVTSPSETIEVKFGARLLQSFNPTVEIGRPREYLDDLHASWTLRT